MAEKHGKILFRAVETRHGFHFRHHVVDEIGMEVGGSTTDARNGADYIFFVPKIILQYLM